MEHQKYFLWSGKKAENGEGKVGEYHEGWWRDNLFHTYPHAALSVIW